MRYFATCPSATLKPEKVDLELYGHHVSIVLDRGVRTYAFATQTFRDRFVNKYRANGARQCGSPF